MHRLFFSFAVLFSPLLMSSSVIAQEAIGIEYVPPQAAAAVVLKPNAIHNSPLLQMVPWEVASVKSKEFTGLAIQDVDSVLLVAIPPGADGMPQAGGVVKFARPVELDALFPVLVEAKQMTSVTDPKTNRRYLKGAETILFDIVPVDEKTYLMGTPSAIKAMQTQQAEPKVSRLADLLRQDLQPAECQMFLLVEPIREIAQFLLADPMLKEFPGLKDIPRQLSHAQLVGNLDMEKGGITLLLTARDETEAAQLENTVLGLLDASAKVASQIAQPKEPDSPEGEAILKYADRISRTLQDALKPSRVGKQVTLSTVGKPGTSPQALLASGTTIVIPLIANAKTEAYRAHSLNNMKQVILASHNYFEVYKKMPRDSYDSEGKPLLSWRVHLLPFLKQSALYDQFHLDEPWDSEHNRKLMSTLPAQFTTPVDESIAIEGRTRYQRPLGEGLPASKEGDLQFQDITDGTSNTLAIVEVPQASAAIWTRPGDFSVDMAFPMQSLMPGDTKGFLGARYDGSVQYFLKRALTNDLLKGLLTHAGGEVVYYQE